MNNPSSAHWRGYLTVLAATMLLSLTGIVIKILLTDYRLEPLVLAFWRVLFVTLALGVILVLVRPSLLRIQSRHFLSLVIFGLVGVGIHQVVWITSVQLNGVAVATTLVYIQPALVAVIAWRLFGESFTREKFAALVLSLIGMVLVSRAYDVANVNLNAFGIAVGLGTGITWATYALMARYHARFYSAWTSLLYAFGFGSLFLLPLQFFVHDPFSLGASVAGWGVLLFLALAPTLGGFGLYTVGLGQLPASVVVIIGMLEPVLSIVLAYFLFGETMNTFQIFGAALILVSVLLLRPRGGVTGDV